MKRNGHFLGRLAAGAGLAAVLVSVRPTASPAVPSAPLAPSALEVPSPWFVDADRRTAANTEQDGPTPDTDGDGLTDDLEAALGTQPGNPDTDGDGLSDGFEIDRGTGPLTTDTDGDGLSDGFEAQFGADPLDRDSDGDRIMDGQDVEWLQMALDQVPEDHWRNGSELLRGLAKLKLAFVEHEIRGGDKREAVEELRELRRHLNGCGTSPDRTDWIIDCTSQVQIRGYFDRLITNLRR